MKVDIRDGSIRLRDVFSGVLFETDEGEKLGVCMRDGGFEISSKDTSLKSSEGEEYYRVYSVFGGVIKELTGHPCSNDLKTDPA